MAKARERSPFIDGGVPRTLAQKEGPLWDGCREGVRGQPQGRKGCGENLLSLWSWGGAGKAFLWNPGCVISMSPRPGGSFGPWFCTSQGGHLQTGPRLSRGWWGRGTQLAPLRPCLSLGLGSSLCLSGTAMFCVLFQALSSGLSSLHET